MTDEPPEASDDELRERRAAEWCTLMHGRHTSNDRAQLDAWLREDLRNLEAYNRMEEVYLLGSKAQRLTSSGATSGEQADPKADRLRWYGMSLAAAIVISAGSFVALHRQSPTVDQTANNSGFTTTGEIRRLLQARSESSRFTLSDGSIVTVGAQSSVLVTFDHARRDLALLKGMARFEVAHEARPFVVSAGGGTVTARGTIFEVSIREDRQVEVKLERGLVAVLLPAPKASAAPSPVVKELHPGERIVFQQKEDAVDTVAKSSAEPPRSASSGQPRTVGDLIEQTNATHAGADRIELEDPNLANRSLGGAFTIRDPATVAERLSIILGLAIDRSMPGRIILRRDVGTPR